jgi:hypothetical protein
MCPDFMKIFDKINLKTNEKFLIIDLRELSQWFETRL